MKTHNALSRLTAAGLLALTVTVAATPQGVAADPSRSKVLIVSQETRDNVDPAKLRRIAKEEDATLVQAAKLPAYSRYVCDTAVLALFPANSWTCDTEYFCAGTMTLTVKVGANNVICQYEDCQLVGEQCDCDRGRGSGRR